jgi:hypothetical protein
MVPPQRRVEEDVPRAQVGDLGGIERLGETGKALEIGSAKIDHGKHLPAGRGIERPRIQVRHLLRWKQCETPPPDEAAGDIVRHVIMRRGDRPVAQPDARQRRVCSKHRMVERQVIVAAEAGQIDIEVGRADIEGGRLVVVQMRADPAEIFVQPHPLAREVQLGDGFVVEIPAAQFRRGGIACDGGAAVETQDIVDCRLRSLPACGRQRPVVGDASQDRRLLLRQQLIVGNRVR